MENFVSAVGMTAGILTTISFFPQLVKVWKTKSTHDISLAMFLTFSTGVALWLAYGLLKADAAIIIANSVTLILALSILVLKIKYH